MLRYAITEGLLPRAERADARLDFVQLRAKSVDAGELTRRARTLLAALADSETKLLINGRTDVALAAGAHGVHLTGSPDELTVEQVRRLMPAAIVSVSCHSLEDVLRARDGGADFMLFGPVFEKRVRDKVVQPGVGLQALKEAIQIARSVKVLALGGIDASNAPACLQAGAAGVAAIRMFTPSVVR